MLTEFALNPSLFDEAAHPDKEAWRDQLRDLGASMFPQVAAWPVLVSNLYGGSWHTFALQIANAVKDQKIRLLCEGILKNAARALVTRPACADWPGEDAVAWGNEAISSHAVEPIERIVLCHASHTTLASAFSFVRRLDEVQGAGFWHGISADWSAPMKIKEKVDALRKLCVHSEFLCLITPHIKGGADDEGDFAVALLKSAFNRPVGFPTVEIEIHTEGPPNPDPATLAKWTSAISLFLKPHVAPGQSVRLVIWPKLLDRFVIAGVRTEVAPGKRQRSPRWGISMSHIARKADAKDPDAFTEWKLLKKDSLGRWFDKYCKDGVTGFCHAAVVTP